MTVVSLSLFRSLCTVFLTDIARDLGMDAKIARSKMRRSLWYHGKGARHVYSSADKSAIIDYLQDSA